MSSRIAIKNRSDDNILVRAKKEFPIVDDTKLRMSLISQADKWNEYAREMIYKTYTDTSLLLLYKKVRDDGTFQGGSKSKVRREVVRFPNGFVYNFCKAVLQPMYGNGWEINPKTWKHELIKPWMLIKA